MLLALPFRNAHLDPHHPDDDYMALPWLIRVKRAAGRPKDLEVIAELEAIHEELLKDEER